MRREPSTECPPSLIAALEDVTIEVAMLQQLVLNIAATAETVSEPMVVKPADKSSH